MCGRRRSGTRIGRGIPLIRTRLGMVRRRARRSRAIKLVFLFLTIGVFMMVISVLEGPRFALAAILIDSVSIPFRVVVMLHSFVRLCSGFLYNFEI